MLVSTDTLNGNVSLLTVTFIFSFAIVSIELIIYNTLLEGIKGVTLGKWLLQIAVVGEDFTAPGLRGSVIRNGIRVVDALPFVVPYVLGTIIARSNAKRQRLGGLGSEKHHHQRLMETGKVLNVAVVSLLWWPNSLDAVQVEVNIHLFLF